ncbi:MAG: VOC family protein [Christensenellaceae bacterium]|nr:VOC family protein [Christensenellaceae bacterium]
MGNGKIVGAAHVGLFIKDIEVSKKYYHDILGFEPIWEYDLDGVKVCFMQIGDLVIELVQDLEFDDCGLGIVNHMAMKVENIEAVKADLAAKGVEFEEKDITFEPRCFPNGSKWILFRGPDGERLEISEVL